MNVNVSFFSDITTLSMPVAGTIDSVPKLGDVGQFVLDEITEWPDRYIGGYVVKKTAPASSVRVVTDAFAEDALKLTEELSEREASLERFRKSFGAEFSTDPVEDPFRRVAERGFARVREARALLGSILMSDEILSLADKIPNERFPNLEDRIRGLLNPDALRFCSCLVGLSAYATSRLASEELAELVRRENGVHSLAITRTGIQHPSAPIQKLRINDPALYSEQIITAGISEFNLSYINFDKIASDYWEGVSKKKLYNSRDISALQKWGVMPTKPGPFFSQFDNPLDKLSAARTQWLETKMKIEKHREIMMRIGSIGMQCFLTDFFGGQGLSWGDLHGEEQSIWVAKLAAEELGIPPEAVDGHELTWSRLSVFIFDFWRLDASTKAADIAEFLDWKFYADVTTSIVVHSAVDHVLSTQMEFSMSHVYGGTRLRFDEYISGKPIEDKRPELVEGALIRKAMLCDPRIYDEHLRRLRDWRDAFEEVFNSRMQNNSSRIVDQYRKTYNLASSELDEIRGMLVNVERIRDIWKVTDVMLSRLGSETFDNARIDIPIDSRVTAIHVAEKEYIPEGRPVVSVKERFRRKARAFLSTEELQVINLCPMDVWRVAVNATNEAANGVGYICIVRLIEPDEPNRWIVQMDVLAVIEPNVPGIVNLPPVVPLSTRYAKPVLSDLTPEALNEVEQSLPTFGDGIISFVERIEN